MKNKNSIEPEDQKIDVESSVIKARVLSQALPYIKKFNGKTIVVKAGGSALVEEKLKNCFAHDVTWLQSVGINIVVVHGGGPQIEIYLNKFNKKINFIDGMRVTDSETMDIVEMVLAGKVNKEIVELINYAGGKAVGLTGQDGNLIKAKKMFLKQNNSLKNYVDIGLVGCIESIKPDVLLSLIDSNFIPIIAPIASGSQGETYNINADLVAGKIAEVLGAEKLVLLTNTPGVLDKKGKLITGLTSKNIDKLIQDKSINEGMIPKINSAIQASKNGVNSVHIIDGRVENSLLLEVLTDRGVGTMIMSR
jgi:acetylglutamate kinase